ncbi:hypothetical protein VX159_02000 [Dechloromonas sp. ZY10]
MHTISCVLQRNQNWSKPRLQASLPELIARQQYQCCGNRQQQQ